MHQIIWEDAPRRRGDDHVTKSRNRKLIRVMSSNESLKYMCVDLSDYNRYLNETGTFLRDVIIMMNKDVYTKRMSGT